MPCLAQENLGAFAVGDADEAPLIVFPVGGGAPRADRFQPAAVVERLAIDERAVEVEQDGLDIWGAQFLV